MLIVKKIFVISTIFLLILGVFFGIYTIAFKPQGGVNVANDDIKGSDTGHVDIADVVGQKMTNITSDSVVSAAFGPNNDTIRYVSGVDGRVWTMTLRGSNKEVLMNEVNGVPQSVKWAPGGDMAIAKYADGKNVVYNYATKTKNVLRDGMDDVVWTVTDGKILYKYYDAASKERSLNIAHADGTNWKKIADIPFRYASFVQVPSSILAAYWPMQDTDTASELLTVSTINESDPKKIFSGLYGADYLFSPNGKKVLVSSLSNGHVTLGIMDSSGANYVDLMVPTLVSKVVWSKDNKTVYYAQPTNLEQGNFVLNDYTTKKFMTKDTFYKMDTESGKKERIIDLEEIKEEVDATQLFLSPAEDVVFFINRANQLLYKISI